MPTIGDIANEINNTLAQIQTNTASAADTAVAIKGDTADIKTEIATLDTTFQTGVAELGGGLFAIWEVEKEVDVLLADGVQQNTAIICWLEKSAELLCRILRRVDTLIDVDTVTKDAILKTSELVDLVHAREALEVRKQAELRARIDACCPPPVPPPEPCYDPCPEPRLRTYDPQGQDWKPPQPPSDPQPTPTPKPGKRHRET